MRTKIIGWLIINIGGYNYFIIKKALRNYIENNPNKDYLNDKGEIIDPDESYFVIQMKKLFDLLN